MSPSASCFSHTPFVYLSFFSSFLLFSFTSSPFLISSTQDTPLIHNQSTMSTLSPLTSVTRFATRSTAFQSKRFLAQVAAASKLDRPSSYKVVVVGTILLASFSATILDLFAITTLCPMLTQTSFLYCRWWFWWSGCCLDSLRDLGQERCGGC